MTFLTHVWHPHSFPCESVALYLTLSLSHYVCVCVYKKMKIKRQWWQKGRQMEKRSGPGGVHKWEMRGAAEANMAQKLSLISNQEGERY